MCSFRPLEAFTLFADIFDAWELGNLWFVATLFLNGKQEAASKYALSLASRRLDDLYAMAAYGFYAYLIRDFDEAEKMFTNVVTFDKRSWIGNLGLAFVYLATDRPKQALVTHLYFHTLMNDFDNIVMPGVGLLASLRTDNCATVPHCLSDYWNKWVAEPYEKKDWITAAMVSIDNQPDYAVRTLRLAFQYRQPLVMLLPQWPVFDPLRARDDFKQLVIDIRAYMK